VLTNYRKEPIGTFDPVPTCVDKYPFRILDGIVTSQQNLQGPVRRERQNLRVIQPPYEVRVDSFVKRDINGGASIFID
jgi:hypothetical protein